MLRPVVTRVCSDASSEPDIKKPCHETPTLPLSGFIAALVAVCTWELIAVGARVMFILFVSGAALSVTEAIESSSSPTVSVAARLSPRCPMLQFGRSSFQTINLHLTSEQPVQVDREAAAMVNFLRSAALAAVLAASGQQARAQGGAHRRCSTRGH